MNRYQILFENYVTDLNTARSAALQWWQRVLENENQKTTSIQISEENLRKRWPFGPASHPYIIAIYRKYYLACVELNNQIELEQSSAPEQPELNNLESDWGEIEDEVYELTDDEVWGEEWVIDPPTLLFEMLEDKYDDLREFMTYFVFPCIGERKDLPS